MSPAQKQIKAFKVGNSEFRADGKNSERESIESLTMEQNTESSLKNDSEYTLEYFLRCSGWGPLEKKTEKRLRIIYLENDYPLLVTLENCLRKAQTKIQTGDMGYRSPHLSHAKRALYHLSYIPSIKSILDYQYCLLGLRYISENRSRYLT